MDELHISILYAVVGVFVGVLEAWRDHLWWAEHGMRSMPGEAMLRFLMSSLLWPLALICIAIDWTVERQREKRSR